MINGNQLIISNLVNSCYTDIIHLDNKIEHMTCDKNLLYLTTLTYVGVTPFEGNFINIIWIQKN